jgi:hypothetical protein
MSERVKLLEETARIVRERGESYGSPEAHFSRTAGAISAIFAHKLREPITAADWSMFMVIDKLAREQHAPKRDNAVDIAGYGACLGEIRAEEKRRALEGWARAEMVRAEIERRKVDTKA